MTHRMEHHREHQSIVTMLIVGISLALAVGQSACGAPAAHGPPPDAACTPEPQPAASDASTPGPAAEATSPRAPAADAAAPAAPGTELAYTKTLAGVSNMEDALGTVKSALAAQGFGVITEIDFQTVMKKKLGVEMKPYWILGACNPKKAHRAIEADPQMGLLLPCKVIVYQDAAGAFIVALARPKTIFGLVEPPQLSSLADEVETEIRAAFDAL